jgi:hypothetical protein
MKTPGGTVRTISSRALVDACANLGVDTDELLRSVGVERQVLLDSDARIPTETLAVLWKRAYELSGDPHLSLHAAESLPFGAYKVVDYIF